MKLTTEEITRLLSWRDNKNCKVDELRPGVIDDLTPMLFKVSISIVSRLMHKAKTTRGKLLRAKKAIDLVLEALKLPKRRKLK
jgi:hypothetical protein